MEGRAQGSGKPLMVGLFTTMQRAKQSKPVATAPATPVRSPPPPPATRAASAALPNDVEALLKPLDRDQLEELAKAFYREVEEADPRSGSRAGEDALRHSLAEYVTEYANEFVEEAEDDREAARAAGRSQALGFVEEEINKLSQLNGSTAWDSAYDEE